MTSISNNFKSPVPHNQSDAFQREKPDRFVLLMGHMLATNHRSNENVACSLVDTGQRFAFQ
jgi:hypothetical protein